MEEDEDEDEEDDDEDDGNENDNGNDNENENDENEHENEDDEKAEVEDSDGGSTKKGGKKKQRKKKNNKKKKKQKKNKEEKKKRHELSRRSIEDPTLFYGKKTQKFEKKFRSFWVQFAVGCESIFTHADFDGDCIEVILQWCRFFTKLSHVFVCASFCVFFDFLVLNHFLSRS